MRSETPGSHPPRRVRVRGRGRRRFATVARLVGALLLVGGVYTAFAPGSSAQDTPLSPTAQEGAVLFNRTCISCHGRDLQGVEGRGPSLIGVGAAAVEFQVSTGRMPLTGQTSSGRGKRPQWQGEELERNTRALAAYVQEMGGGPMVPPGSNLAAGGDAAAGGELYRVNCSSCHSYSGVGGALSSGKFAPSLKDATQRQIYAAMLSGPQNMPVFGDNQLSPEQKADLIAYIESLQEDADPGGVFNLGQLGPSTEGLAIFLFGMVALVFGTLWIAGKS